MINISSTTSKRRIHIAVAVRVAILRYAAVVLLLLLLSRCICGSSGLTLRILVMRLGVWVVLPVGLVGVLVREDVLHGFTSACVRACSRPPPRERGCR